MWSTLVSILLLTSTSVFGSNANKPHNHQGMLEPYDGSLLKMIDLSTDQQIKLDRGEAVVYNERNGQFGRGIVVHDINANPAVCMEKIRDLAMYPKMVPNLKSINVYDSVTFANGTTKEKAKFELGVFGFSIGYFLHMTHEPSLNTLTWTLDYSKTSDMDDSVGHWQVMAHPKKEGWTRILYSTKIKLQAWVPEFFIQFMTSKALTEATGWLKREAEKEQQGLLRAKHLQSASGTHNSNSNSSSQSTAGAKKPTWFSLKGGSISAVTSQKMASVSKVSSSSSISVSSKSSGLLHFRSLNMARFKRL